MHLQQAFPFLAIISLLSLRTKVSLKFPQHLTPSSAVVAYKSWSIAKRVSSSDVMGNSRKYLYLTTDSFHVLTLPPCPRNFPWHVYFMEDNSLHTMSKLGHV